MDIVSSAKTDMFRMRTAHPRRSGYRRCLLPTSGWAVEHGSPGSADSGIGPATFPVTLADHFSDVWISSGRVQMLYVAVIPAARDAEKSAHRLDGIFVPILMDHSKFNPGLHLFSWLR